MKQRLMERLSRLSGLSAEELQEAVETPSNFDPKNKERHPTLDFFVCPSFTDVAPKAERVALEHPMAMLSPKGNKEPYYYEHKTKHGTQSVLLTPSYYGSFLITDRDLIIYALSQLMHALNKGEKISRVVRFSIYQFIVATNKSTGSTYRELETMLSRLSGTRIRTTLKTGGVTNTTEFGMLDGWRTEKHDKELKGKVELTLSDFLMRAILHKEVLTLSRDYFLIEGGLKRRMYELSRKFTGRQAYWMISLELLHKKSGSTTKSMSAFRQMVKRIAKENDLPDYAVKYSAEKDNVIFLYRNKKPEKKREPKPAPMLTATQEADRELERKNRKLN